MSRIKIQNFGPIELFEHDVDKNFTVIIGEQASGKSMIAKIIFFCRNIPEELKRYVLDSKKLLLESSKELNLITSFQIQLRTIFMEYFGIVKNMEPFLIEYVFDNHKKVRIQLKDEYVNIRFSEVLEAACADMANKTKEYFQKESSLIDYIFQNKDRITDEQFNMVMINQKIFSQSIYWAVDRIFGQNDTSIFIPANRSILITESDIFNSSVASDKYNILMKSFIQRIDLLKKQYSQGLEDIVKDKKNLSTEQIDFESVNKAIKLIKRILKGEYRNEKNGEKIYYAEDKFVRLTEASSGQQESLWIVLLIFSIILDRQQVYLVIEEPEAHLFPNAQKDMMELIALMINSTNSRVVLATHSPYILTAANLLIYSAHVEKENKEKEIVPKEYRLSMNEVAAYLLKEYRAEDITDRENYMIDASRIDVVSEGLNAATDKLVEMEMKNGL